MNLQRRLAVLFIFVLTFMLTANKFVQTLTEKHFCVSQTEQQTDTFDFRKLDKSDEDYIVPHDDKEYRLQLCRELVKPCNGKKGYNICMRVGNQEIGFGKLPPKFINNERGRLHFLFIGDPFNETENYTANIKMSCDFSSSKVQQTPEIFPLGESGKDLFIFWKTKAACTEEFQTNCTTIDKYGNHYDLNPLKKFSDNYRIDIQNSQDLFIILNVCHSVIYGLDSVCNRQSGICWQDSTNPHETTYTNLGNVIPNVTVPFFEDDTLKLRYEGGSMCRYAVNSGHIQSTITFICDFTQTDSEPEYVGGREKCHYQLVWKTASACNVEALKNHSLMTADQCTVTNPTTNTVYDLRLLRYRELSIMSSNGTKFEIKICAPLSNNRCGKNSGLCNMDTKVSYGQANSKLLWEEGGPYLNYTDGDICDNGKPRYTKIGFYCGPDGEQVTYPTVMEIENCYSVIYWSVNFVCEDKKIKCFTEEHNLNPLIQSVHNYIVIVNDTEYHINVCRPLVAKQDLTCAHGSAVCKATRNPTGKLINETSLGYAVENLYVDGSNTVLLYKNGSVCPENPSNKLASKIIFSCDYNTNKGSPRLKSYSDCTYVFEWKTRYVCPSSVGKFFENNCTILTDAFHESDLSKVKHKVYNTQNERGDDYTVCVCGCESRCHGSVCKGSLSFGNISNVLIKYDEDVVILKYISTEICNKTEKYVAEVRMICNESAGISVPTFVWDKQCFVEFKWETNIACISKMSLVPNTSDNLSKENGNPSVINLLFAVILLAIVVLVTIIYCRHSSQRSRCFNSCTRPCSTRKVNDSVKYSRVNTTEEARLLLDGSDNAVACQTDSSDDELLDDI